MLPRMKHKTPETFEMPEMQEISTLPKAQIAIEKAYLLHLDDQTLIFEFETPMDGFMLPENHTAIYIVFEDRTRRSTMVIEQDSSKPGPHAAGLTIRLALKLEGQGSRQHDEARICWQGRIRRGNQSIHVDVQIRVPLAE